MKERSIIFSSDMVRAILDGRKTQTRRVIKPQPCDWVEKITYDKERSMCIFHGHEMGMQSATCGFEGQPIITCPYGKVGDRLWVRETWKQVPIYKPGGWEDTLLYKATGDNVCQQPGGVWKPSIHMPRWASRITLEITDIRVERLQEISERDAFREGCDCRDTGPLKFSGPIIVYKMNIAKFKDLWNSLAKKGFKWEDNPWVWVISFKKIV